MWFAMCVCVCAAKKAETETVFKWKKAKNRWSEHERATDLICSAICLCTERRLMCVCRIRALIRCVVVVGFVVVEQRRRTGERWRSRHSKQLIPDTTHDEAREREREGESEMERETEFHKCARMHACDIITMWMKMSINSEEQSHSHILGIHTYVYSIKPYIEDTL